MRKVLIVLGVVILVASLIVLYILNATKEATQQVHNSREVSQEEADAAIMYFNDKYGNSVVEQVRAFDPINYGSYLVQLEERLESIEFSDPDVYLDASDFNITDGLTFRLESLPVISLIITMKDGVTTLKWDTSMEW